ncbi:thioredoxin [Streptomyces qinzhouensis]|uniref:Thioredoxin n=1 Tax=Streptomyces qinzhouensis TaxID=2599401 RepID=A0A5B8J595_9ACTN|nr:thioredoxin [Streptomyces qinzhouensis]QDY75544.1 thioredoxin [Streptomyces qinzhouensis]
MTAESCGLRVQEALDRLTGTGVRDAGEQLVRELLAFHGEGLAALVAAVPPQALAAALDDPAAAGLLVLHDLHPEDTAARIRRALRSAADGPGAAAAGTVEFTGFDPATGALTLRRPPAGGCGCGTDGTARVEGALACHAPEVTSVVWETAPAAPPLLQIGTRPPAGRR